MRPPKPFTKENEACSARIDAAIKRVGIAKLSEAHGVLPWSIYKWRNAGRVANEHLETFCQVTGESPWDVCDPALAFMQAARHKSRPDATKSRRSVKKVAV